MQLRKAKPEIADAADKKASVSKYQGFFVR
jgi:hypothetical protein